MLYLGVLQAAAVIYLSRRKEIVDLKGVVSADDAKAALVAAFQDADQLAVLTKTRYPEPPEIKFPEFPKWPEDPKRT